MLRRLVPLILSYVLFFGGHNILYTVFLPQFSPTSLAAMLAFVAALIPAVGALWLTEKGLGISSDPVSAAVLRKPVCALYLWLGFWGLFFVNAFFSLLFSPQNGTEYTAGSLLLALLSAVIVHPIGEELLFRRLYLPRIEGYLPGSGAVAVTAILFALTHYASGAGNMLYALFGGMILGFVYRSTRKLIFPVLLHGAVNLLGILLPDALLPAARVISAGVLALSLLFFIIHTRKEKRS